MFSFVHFYFVCFDEIECLQELHLIKSCWYWHVKSNVCKCNHRIWKGKKISFWWWKKNLARLIFFGAWNCMIKLQNLDEWWTWWAFRPSRESHPEKQRCHGLILLIHWLRKKVCTLVFIFSTSPPCFHVHHIFEVCSWARQLQFSPYLTTTLNNNDPFVLFCFGPNTSKWLCLVCCPLFCLFSFLPMSRDIFFDI